MFVAEPPNSMQYSAAVILLHRPLAHFGSCPIGQKSNSEETSRQICVQHACLIAQYLQQYEEFHGSIRTLSWITLHIIATAATTLIATLSETSDDRSACHHQLSSLQTCIDSLVELEKSHLPTRRVRRLILHAMRLLNLDSKTATSARSRQDVVLDNVWGPESLNIPIGGIWGGEMQMIGPSEPVTFDEFLPAGSQTDMLLSFQSLLS